MSDDSIKLSAVDSEAFARAISRTPRPNEALRRAADRYYGLVDPGFARMLRDALRRQKEVTEE